MIVQDNYMPLSDTCRDYYFFIRSRKMFHKKKVFKFFNKTFLNFKKRKSYLNDKN